MSEKEWYLKGFGMVIPQGVTRNPPKPKGPSIWIRLLCATIGHNWGFAGITYTGPNFPRKCKRCKKKKWFSRPTFRMRASVWIDKTLDKLWPILCKAGIHRYKYHYSYATFSYGGPGISEPTINQKIYKCSCCNKIKTVTLK